MSLSLLIFHPCPTFNARVARAARSTCEVAHAPGWDALHRMVADTPPGAVLVPAHAEECAAPAPELRALLRRSCAPCCAGTGTSVSSA